MEMGGKAMMINCPGAEWVMKLGPITRTSQAKSRKEAEESAWQKVLDAVDEIMEKAKPLVPLLAEGAVCAGGGELEVREDPATPQAFSYQLEDETWFAYASSGFFGMKLLCRAGGG